MEGKPATESSSLCSHEAAATAFQRAGGPASQSTAVCALPHVVTNKAVGDGLLPARTEVSPG